MKNNFLQEMPGRGRRLLAVLPGVSGGSRPALPKGPARHKPRRQGATRFAITELRSNLTFTARTVTAWFTCEEQVWPFQPDAKRESLIEAAATQYAALSGAVLHVRRTAIPFDAGRWAKALETNSQPLPDAPTSTGEQILDRTAHYNTWRDHVAAATARITAGDFTVSRTQIGVVFALPSAGLLRARTTDLPETLLTRIDETAETLAGFGLQARPSTTEEMTSLIYRSVAIGLTPPVTRPGDIGPDHISEFDDAVEWVRAPYDMTTQLVDRWTGQSVHVAVLTVGRVETLTIPQIHQPWAHLSDQLGFPVEWSSRIQVVSSGVSAIERQLLTVRAQQRDYAEHGLPEPPEMERVARRAAAISDEISTGLPVDATRAYGWHRLAVYGDTAKECLARVRELTRLYDRQHTQLVHPRGQADLLREFVPGEPAADTRYLRRIPVRMMAAAMPQASGRVGDDQGDLIGFTATSGERPVFHDPHFPMEVRERSGLSVFVSEPGGGKSTLMGAFGYLNARRGVQVTLMDPSGPLARLCQMPEIAPYARVINLTGQQPGTLAPYALVPTPQREHFDDTPDGQFDYETAVAFARSERAALVQDVCKMLLPPVFADDMRTITFLGDALRAVPKEDWSTLDDVVTMLFSYADPYADNLGRLLQDCTELPVGRLFFGQPPAGALAADAALTVITMGGLQLPDMKVARKDWSVQQALAVPAMHLANRLAVRRCYSGDQHARKMVGIDEAHIMDGWDSGAVFLNRLSRDSRKWNIAALVASQNPRDILRLDVQNLVSSVFVGRIAENPNIAAGALELLGLPTGVGYEATLAALSQYSISSTAKLGYREFVMRDVDGRTQKVCIDLSHIAGLLAALNTTPGGTR